MEKHLIAVVGAEGKMGTAVCEELAQEFDIIELDRQNDLSEGLQAELFVDFGGAKSSVLTAKFCCENHIPFIVGSTGQSEAELREIFECAERVPAMVCSNFSVGITLLKTICSGLAGTRDFDITIFEKHHAKKLDVPSGTALDIEMILKRKTKKSVPIISERGGVEIGTHQVDFYFGDELLSIRHQAFSRKAFASGVKVAVRFMLTRAKPRAYAFEEAVTENKFEFFGK